MVVLCLGITTASGQFVQLGDKLLVHGSTSDPRQGLDVDVSGDGRTAVIAGPGDNNGEGGIWVFVRQNDAWVQQGGKLLGTGAEENAYQGASVAISDDGNTIIVGGTNDAYGTGAAWVFVRSGGTWVQQGTKLVGSGATYKSNQGGGVVLSHDGNTALVGGYGDSNRVGAVWVFVRSGGVWIQQGPKLVGSGSAERPAQGGSIDLSADGNTAVVGGSADSTEIGAFWTFTRSGDTWSQMGEKVVAPGGVGIQYQGCDVSISADGNTALIGANGDSGLTGCARVYMREGNAWVQQGEKLVPWDVGYHSGVGSSVALSDDGNTAVVGAMRDDSQRGALWVFKRDAGAWSQYGIKLVGTGGSWDARQGRVAISGDATTVFSGGVWDNSGIGATWVFVDRSIDVTVSDPRSADPAGAGGLVRLFAEDGELVASGATNDSGRVSFYAVAPGTGYTCSVDWPSPDTGAVFDTTYWGSLDGVTLVSGRTTSVLFERNAPRLDSIDVLDAGSGVSVRGSVVHAGFPLRLRLTVTNPHAERPAHVQGRIMLRTDSTGGYPLVLATEERDLMPESTGVLSVILTPTAEGAYTGAAGVMTGVPGGLRVSDALEFRSTPLFTTVLPPLPGVPLLAYPEPDVPDQAVDLQLRWHPAQTAARYHVQLATDSTFAAGLLLNDSTITDTVRQTGALPFFKWLYWRVRAVNLTGASAYGPVWAFRTRVDTPATPVLKTPLRDAVGLLSSVEFRWYATPGAEQYHIQLSPDSAAWSGPLVDDSLVTDTSLAVHGLRYVQAYRWRVRARNASGAGSWSEVRGFRTRETDPAIPTLIAPADGASTGDSTVHLAWSRPEGSQGFIVHLAPESLFTPGPALREIVSSDSTVSVRGLSFASRYWWRVTARFDSSVYGPTSPAWTFITGLPVPGAVQLLQPARDLVIARDTLTFVWRKAGPNVLRYWLEYAIDSTFVVKAVDSLVSDTSRTVAIPGNGLRYYWRVRAGNPTGWGVFSEARTFTRALVAAGRDGHDIPERWVLEQSYPNPFNPSTTIRYGLPVRSHSRLVVFNTIGEEVAVLQDGNEDAGYHEVRFDASGLPSGVYLCRIRAGAFVATTKLLLVR